MGPNKEVVVKNLIQKRITPLTRVSLEALVIVNEVISMVVQQSEEQEELQLAEEALKGEAEWPESGASKSNIIPPGAAVRRIRPREQYPLVGCPVLRISMTIPGWPCSTRGLCRQPW